MLLRSLIQIYVGCICREIWSYSSNKHIHGMALRDALTKQRRAAVPTAEMRAQLSVRAYQPGKCWDGIISSAFQLQMYFKKCYRSNWKTSITI